MLHSHPSRIVTKAAFAVFMLAFCVSIHAQTSPTPPANSRPAPWPNAPARLSLAPHFALKSLTGETVRLSDFRGKVVLLNFWADWCQPAKIQMTILVELQNQYGPQGLQVLGIDLDEDLTKVEIGESADKMQVNYPTLLGTKKVANAYGSVPALPTTFVIGRDGKTIDSIIGLKNKPEIEKIIKNALNL